MSQQPCNACGKIFKNNGWNLRKWKPSDEEIIIDFCEDCGDQICKEYVLVKK